MPSPPVLPVVPSSSITRGGEDEAGAIFGLVGGGVGLSELVNFRIFNVAALR